MNHPIHFVSLGPGDPELITLKGLKTLQKADIIYCPATQGNHEELYPALLRCGNIPSAFAQTASTTLANATLPFAVQLAGKGAEQALADNKHLRRGLTTYAGKLTLLETAKKLEMPFTSPEEAIGM